MWFWHQCLSAGLHALPQATQVLAHRVTTNTISLCEPHGVTNDVIDLFAAGPHAVVALNGIDSRPWWMGDISLAVRGATLSTWRTVTSMLSPVVELRAPNVRPMAFAPSVVPLVALSGMSDSSISKPFSGS
jgi:hypothetical protein